MRVDYQWTPRDVVGGSCDPVYVYGVTPSGHQSAETVQGTYQRHLTSDVNGMVGAGPLFIQSSSPQIRQHDDNSYAVNASISRQLRQSQFSAGYTRAFLVNLLEPAVATDSIQRMLISPRGITGFSAERVRIHTAAATDVYGAGHVVGGSAQISYQLTTEMQFFAQYSIFRRLYSYGTAQPSTWIYAQPIWRRNPIQPRQCHHPWRSCSNGTQTAFFY